MHNQRGWQDAEKRVKQLKAEITHTIDHIDNLETLRTSILSNIRKNIIANRYSGYKSHSFRRYMHALEQYFNNPAVDLSDSRAYQDKFLFEEDNGMIDIEQTLRESQGHWSGLLRNK